MDSSVIQSSYSLSINLNQHSNFKFLEHLGETISYLPIKQLIFNGLDGPPITELLMILRRCPHLIFLSVQSTSVSHIDDDENQNMNEEYRFNNIHLLEVNALIQRKWVTCIMKYLPKVNNVYVYCNSDESNVLCACGPFPSRERQLMDYTEGMRQDREIITMEFISNFYSDVEWKKLFNFLDTE